MRNQVLPCAGIQLRRPWVRTAVSTSAPLAAAITALMAVVDVSAGVVLPAAMTAVLLFAAAGVLAMRDRRRPGGTLTFGIDRVAVRSDGRYVAVDRVAVLAGYELPGKNAVVLQLREGKHITIELATPEATPEQILEHLGVDVRRRTVAAPMRGALGPFTQGLLSLLGGYLLGFAGACVLGYPALASACGLLAGALAVVAVLSRFGWPKVVVGIDGVRVEGRWSRPFVPYSEIRDVSRDGDGMRLTLRNGAMLSLPMIGQSSDQLAALLRRIDQGRHAPETGQGRFANVLARQGRSPGEWHEDVRRMALSPPAFRDQAVATADLEAVLIDASAPAEQRIGAALALRAVDPSACVRIRVAAAALANPVLREALEDCAREDGALDEGLMYRATVPR